MSEAVMADIEAEAREDWLGFADIVALVADAHGVELEISAAILSEAVATTVALVRAGRLVPGTLPDRLVPWPLDPENAAQRIEREAEDLIARYGHIPLGAIAWFTVPDFVQR